MPIITNFGDVVTVGNAAVNGTGTSSFAGPVTFAQGVSITGAISTSSAFYGVLAGANTAAVSALTASTNVYAPIVTTPVSNAATAIATTGFYGALVGQNVASVTVLTASSNINTPTANVTSLNVSTQANVTFLNVSSSAFLSNANVLTANITSSNILTGNVSTLNVSGFATLLRMNVVTANITSANVLTENVSTLNVSGFATLVQANVLTANITSSNVLTENVATLNVSGFATLIQANVLTANVTSLNVSTQANVTFLNVSSTAYLSSANIITANLATANIASLNVTGDANVANVTVRSNLYTSNIIMSSNLSTNTGYGNVYLTGNLVVQGNIFSLGGSVGSGSGTSQGILYSLATPYSLGSPFATGSAGPAIAGYHINLSPTYFNPEATQSVSAFSAGTGMLKFATGGLYQVTCVIVGDQPIVKLAFGKTSSSSFAALPTSAISGYDYVYNFPVGSSPSTVITIPLTVQDTSQYYYLDVFFSTAAGTPSTLYPTRSTTAAGSNYGTYVQVGPFGNYLTSATGVASGLLMNCYGTTTLSSPVTSNTFRLAMTSSNGWTVNGVSTVLTVTSGGNFQVSQVGIYEVSLCLNPSATPMMFGVGSLATDGAPTVQGPYLYQYAPMYTQDPTTVVSMPLNITDTSKYYYLDVIFPGTQSTVTLSNVSTFVSLKPVGSYVSPSTNPWSQQGTSVYYTGGAVGIGGVNPSLLTETFTVNGNTSFVGNVTVTSDVSSNTYVLAKRVPAGSLDVTQYVTGRVPLTTTTNLIQNYLSNAASIRSNTSTGTITQALYCPGTATSYANLGSVHSISYANLALSNLLVECWINPSTVSPTQSVFTRQNASLADFGFYLNAGGAPQFYVYTTGGATPTASNATALVAGNWYHLALSYQALTTTTGTVRCFVNGGVSATVGSLSGSQPRVTSTASIYIGGDSGTAQFYGNIADVRVFSGGIVPVANFTPAAAPFGSSQPAYLTGTPTLLMSLNSQYFPGASTSPYGPCLTLPGTANSYYTETGTFLNTTLNSGFTIEAWVNYASLANSNTYYFGTTSHPFTIVKGSATSGNTDWAFGVLTTGQVTLYYYNGGGGGGVLGLVSSGTITTGSWNHLVCQGNTASNVNMFINGTIQTLTGQNYTPAGNGTTAPALSGTVTTNQYSGVSVGQQNNLQGPNFAIAKARVLFGANTYTTTTFTPSPNLGPVPAGATVAWSLDTQYPLPTFPSIQDVTPLPSQLTSYGAVPTPVGGVTSNVLGPLTAYPAFDSIRFDGTGYIDYGNAASSVMNSNLWASPWTIEAWVYPTNLTANYPNIISRSNAATSDWYLNLAQTTGVVGFISGVSTANFGTLAAPLNTWTHVAATYDGTRSNVYVGGALSNSMVASAMSQTFTPTLGLNVGYTSGQYMIGNLADVRVSNTAIYTGSSFTVPSAPLPVLSSTMLLLRSLGGQTGTTLEVQGRGLNSTSIGAGRVIQSYPPAPMSSYLLDTTSNASVTYGQGKYVASASSEGSSPAAWMAFNKTNGSNAPDIWYTPNNTYNGSSPFNYTGSVVTVDTLGNAYAGEWLQIQLPVSVILSSYAISCQTNVTVNSPSNFVFLGSRDGTNWTLVNKQSGFNPGTIGAVNTFAVSATQAFNYYRLSIQNIVGNGTITSIGELILNGTEESLCVTSDSKVGVGIANPQRALEVAGDLVVSGTISGGAGLGSFRNRIINGDMRIAQRGASNVLPYVNATYTYLIDRLAIQIAGPPTSGVITQYQTALGAAETPYQLGLRNYANVVVSVGFNGTAANPVHIIEGYNIQDFNWGTSFASPVTLSFWFRSNAPIGSMFSYSLVNYGYGSASYVGTFTIASSGTWQYYTFTVPPPPNGSTWGSGTNGGIIVMIAPYYIGGYTSTVNAWNSGSYTYFPYGGYPWPTVTGTYINFTGVQLEKGTVATPFEFRPYATELALCQRYYQLYNTSGSSGVGGILGIGSVNSSTSVVFAVPLRADMRVAPTSMTSNATVGSNYLVVQAGGSSSVTAITLVTGQTSSQMAWVQTTSTSGLTAGGAAIMYGGGVYGTLGFNAEL